MTPKEKAEELFEAMKGFRVKHTHSKKCARVAVEQIELALTNYGATSDELQNMDSEWRFWQSVTNELNKY
jgi:hypothetical protein